MPTQPPPPPPPNHPTQHSRSSFQKCSSDGVTVLLKTLPRASHHGPKEMCPWNPAAQDSGSASLLDSQQHPQEPFTFTGHISFHPTVFFQRTIIIIAMAQTRRTQHACQGKAGVLFLLFFVLFGGEEYCYFTLRAAFCITRKALKIIMNLFF